MVKKKLKLKKSTKINLKKVLDIINDKSNQKIFATFLLLFSVLTIIAFIFTCLIGKLMTVSFQTKIIL